MAKIGFEFPLDNSGQWDGFNDPGIEHFTGNRLQHLGREVPQNTIDAKLSKPARLVIKLLRLPVSKFPDIEQFKTVIGNCARFAPNEGNEKAVKFFAEAAKILNGPYVPVLQIRDSNTKGVEGPCENGKPFFALMKATGQSKKSETSTGSYGIGKFAPFTVSELRTVFVTTVWKDESGTIQHYVQGKSVLMSFKDRLKRTHRGTGFWGVTETCQPVKRVEQVPDWLRLAGKNNTLDGQQGTMISIVGFDQSPGWQNVLAANIIENFFGAISRGELEVSFSGGITIDQTTLADALQRPEIRSAITDLPGEPEKFDNVTCYLSALSADPEVILETHENLHLGRCELRILIGGSLPKKVAILRNGMLITESLPGLKRFSDLKEFVAILECPTDKGQTLLRAMEPPKHDAFEPDRLPPDKRKQGAIALKELAAWVRLMLTKHAKDPVSEETNLDELADFFGDADDEGKKNKKDENPGGAVVIQARRIIPKKRVASANSSNDSTIADDPAILNESDGLLNDMTENEEHDTQNHQKAKPDVSNRQTKEESGGGSTFLRKPMKGALELLNVRAPALATGRRNVAFTTTQSCTLLIELQDSGADSNYFLAVKAASKGVVKDGRIEEVTVVAGQRCVIDVEFENPFAGTIRVVANAI